MQSPTNNSDLAVPPGDLQFTEKVGSGGYGEVWKGKWRGKGGGIIVAIKKVAVNKMNPRQQREILVEVGIHSIHLLSLSHSCSYLFVILLILLLFALQHVIMFDSNHISSPSSDIQTSSQSLGRVSLRKGSFGSSWSSWREGACTSGCTQTWTLDGMYDSGMPRYSLLYSFVVLSISYTIDENTEEKEN